MHLPTRGKRSICMVSPSIPPDYSGAGAQAYRLAVGLSRAGIPVSFITKTTGPLTTGFPEESVDLVRIRVPGPRRASLALFYIAMALVLLARRRQYRLVHVHGVYWAASVAAIAARAVGMPMVVKVTLVGSDDASTVFAFAARHRILGRLRLAPLMWSSAIVATTPHIRDDAIKNGLSPARVRLLPNAVDTAFFRLPSDSERQSARAALGIRGLLVLFAGGFLHRKGLHLAIRAFACFANSRKDVALHILGPASGLESSDSGYPAQIRSLLHEVDLDDKCRMVGWVDSNRLRSYFWASDALIFPSASEGLPNLLLEALSSGTPCVANDIPSIRSISIRSDLLRLVDAHESQEVAHAIQQLIGQGRGRETAESARSEIESRFSMTALVHSYSDLYEEIEEGTRAT